MANSNKSESADVQLSKTLSWILRHGARQLNIQIDDEGFVDVDELLSLPQLRGACWADVKKVVETNSKKRFALKFEADRVYIKANQGHSFAVDNLDLKLISSVSEIPMAVHGTYFRNWPAIKAKGLSRMNRQHIHFASDVNRNKTISGMRGNCDLFIYVNVEKAINDGFKFYLSPNGVILCAGNEHGFLPAIYFKEVIRSNNGINEKMAIE